MSNVIAKRKTCEEFHACTIDSDIKTNCTEYEKRGIKNRFNSKCLQVSVQKEET